MKDKGIIFVVSGPSGCGKTTLCKRLLKGRPKLVKSTSVTSRPLRKGERRNIDYIYVTEDGFKARIRKREFLEYARVCGNYYGTPKGPIEEALKRGKDLLLNIDVQGAAQVRKVFKNAVFIFILPPTFEELKKRLLKRSSDSALQIKKRLKIASHELQAISSYDYAVINDNVEEATGRLAAIITGERNRIKTRKRKE